jgi:hypothetical protein
MSESSGTPGRAARGSLFYSMAMIRTEPLVDAPATYRPALATHISKCDFQVVAYSLSVVGPLFARPGVVKGAPAR